VPRQYSLHRWLTFGSAVPYGPRLARAYVLYAAIALLTTALNWLLVEQLGCRTALPGLPASRRRAWSTCSR